MTWTAGGTIGHSLADVPSSDLMPAESLREIGNTRRMVRTIVRHAGAGDALEVARLMDVAGTRGELDGFHAGRSQVTAEFLAAMGGTLVVAEEGDRLIGFMSPDIKWLVVDPGARRRGIGRLLVAAGMEIERRRGRPELLVAPIVDNAGALAFLEACGFRHHSSVWEFVLPGEVDVPPPQVPDGMTLRAYERVRDIDTLMNVANAAFVDHPTPLVFERRDVELSETEPEFEPADIVLLVRADAPDDAIGFCMVDRIREEDRLVAGDVTLVGVEPSEQGHGHGRELLRWGIQRLREASVPRLTLSVNVTNQRALLLYELTGFVRVGERPRWALAITAEPPRAR